MQDLFYLFFYVQPLPVKIVEFLGFQPCFREFVFQFTHPLAQDCILGYQSLHALLKLFKPGFQVFQTENSSSIGYNSKGRHDGTCLNYNKFG